MAALRPCFLAKETISSGSVGPSNWRILASTSSRESFLPKCWRIIVRLVVPQAFWSLPVYW
ncbi:hypothetical protein D3C72_2564950 [compost metagenome]